MEKEERNEELEGGKNYKKSKIQRRTLESERDGGNLLVIIQEKFKGFREETWDTGGYDESRV